ncbi:MDR family MFS transporter [Thermogemmatispora carboxidivorans]|uniref:MDR family MFS transporter n=1 Tax=Thermogemmatispora carboxidivorans TaxID=1382306 RepID=UPI0009E00D9B|nr:MDR family MFS transporter [Thermogemmatispora carboxidivorans]
MEPLTPPSGAGPAAETLSAEGTQAVAAATAARPTQAMAEELPRFSARETALTMAGVLMVMLLASLDQTIVSTAMPRIIGELQGFDRYTWVSTAYLLASTVMVPIYGKLSDLVGRKPIFLFGVVIFLLGSALSGAAQSMNQLIAFRAFQGLGAGALLPIAMAIVGDLFTPRERGKWQGLTGAIWGLSSIIGPTLGGWITQNTSWRWVFYVNLPIGIVALLVLIFLMPALRGKNRQVSIDYLGAVLLVLGALPLLLGFSLAGNQYDWLSPQILGLLAGAVVFLTAFLVYEARLERRQGQPIIEPGLFKNSIFTVSTIVTVIFGMGLFGSVFFIPLFVQGVVGTTATNSGLILTPLMLTSVAGSILSGQLVSRIGKYKWIAITGMAISVVGSYLLTRLDVHSTNTDVLIAMLVLGLGMGFGMSLYTLVVQNAMPVQKIGQATSAMVFFRQIGATVGLAAMGSIMTSAYQPAFDQALPAMVKQVVPARFLSAFNNPEILLSDDARQQMQRAAAAFGPQGQQLLSTIMEAVKTGLAQGIHNVFVLSFVLMVVALVAVFFLKEIKLRDRRRPQSQGAGQGEGEPAPEAGELVGLI